MTLIIDSLFGELEKVEPDSTNRMFLRKNKKWEN